MNIEENRIFHFFFFFLQHHQHYIELLAHLTSLGVTQGVEPVVQLQFEG